MRGWVGWSDSKSWFSTRIDLLCKIFFGAILCGNSNGKIVSGQILGKYNKCFAKRRQPKQASFSIGAPSDAEGSLTKSGAPRVLKIFLNIFSYFSLSV